jgi:hypothetical protein
MPDGNQVASGLGGPAQFAEDDKSSIKLPTRRVDAVEEETARLSTLQENLPTSADLEASLAKLQPKYRRTICIYKDIGIFLLI